MNEEPRRFTVTARRRTRDFFHAILLLILLGSATCAVFLSGTAGSVEPEKPQFVGQVSATNGGPSPLPLRDR